jgi:NADPH-dependent curcumin reductase CurA
MAAYVRDGKVPLLEQTLGHGLQDMGKAFVAMMRGENIGKVRATHGLRSIIGVVL